MKKVCSRCKRNRRIGKFAKDASRVDRKRIYCRECISIFNNKYRLSPMGKIKHRISVDKWKKKNKAAIRKYNKEYYRRKKHIILYNKRCRELTENMIVVDNCVDIPKLHVRNDSKTDIVINPQRKSVSK